MSKKDKKINVPALRAFDIYGKTARVLERANLAIGKKASFRISTSSTAHSAINTYGISSTQKI